MSRSFAMTLALAALALACSRPVPVRPEAPEKPAACPACECEACPACPVCPTCPAPAADPAAAAAADAEPVPPPAPVEVPEHLRPSREQCKGACDKLMDLEIRRVSGRISDAQPALLDALKKGLAEEKSLLADACLKRCLAEFTVATALCVRRFEEFDKVRACVLDTSLEKGQ